jgi:cohesin domain-containing protein
MKKIFLAIFLILSPTVLAYDFGEWDEGVENAEEYDEYMGVVILEGEFLNGDILQVGVKAENLLSTVLGISFHLKYESEKLEFLRYEPGEFLERGGDPFYLVQNIDGEVVFGETLRRGDNYPIGEGEIVKIYFQIIDDGVFAFNFERGVISTLDIVRQDLDRIDWQDSEISREMNISEIAYASVQNSINKDVSSNSMKFLLPLASICAAFVIILWIRKSKRRLVNFKSSESFGD